MYRNWAEQTFAAIIFWGEQPPDTASSFVSNLQFTRFVTKLLQWTGYHLDQEVCENQRQWSLLDTSKYPST